MIERILRRLRRHAGGQVEPFPGRSEGLGDAATQREDLGVPAAASISQLSLPHAEATQREHVSPAGSEQERAAPVGGAAVRPEPDLDRFFSEFSDEFRGSEEEISARLRVYLPILTRLPPVLDGMSVVDLGCGRGELLRLLSGAGIHGVGVDSNADAVGKAMNSGLQAVLSDALSYLQELPTASLGAVTGIHIVEHLPHPRRLELFQECLRVLSPGGAVVFETPNPQSASVGSYTFWLDPSHISPIPPQLLDFSLKFCGFHTETLLLQPMRPSDHPRNAYLREVYDAMFGYADYAVIGRKPL